MSAEVVLVNAHDEPVGVADKLEAHEQGWLHRAFSVFVFDPKGRLLLQQRNVNKYHSGALWSNTCCSHPHPGEAVEDAAQRRLHEEMGFQCPLDDAFTFTYRAVLSDTMIEHEYDHVLIGQDTPTVRPNADEVQDWRWMAPNELMADVAAHPEHYTAWFRMAVERVLTHAHEQYPTVVPALDEAVQRAGFDYATGENMTSSLMP
ncbi:isopentenyl-diphosphate delta-isomerase [Longimonas halophila]|uniref:Isopentenyl-diphosphate delta-isomerase n=1 Tax=Longimonas halophila TaxID=1469170 RepID=A0A2H3P1B8_9BACT|nr:isopentenyl-diphosphate Delta-isomerase [Longimonas halophila]PEN07666.1 isopentenyl-diphosphate delta-isomerase [Longimonas halophila]